MLRLRFKVEDCENWWGFRLGKGQHCYNCTKRNGHPMRGQPDENCANFKLRGTDRSGARDKAGERE